VAAVKSLAEQRAATLRDVVEELRSQGVASVRTIAAALNARGILTPREGAWHATSVSRLLKRLNT
jgi:hypothetical protein